MRIPKAFVNFSKPIRSTTRIERSAEKQAVDGRLKNVNYKLILAYFIQSKLPIAIPNIVAYVN